MAELLEVSYVSWIATAISYILQVHARLWFSVLVSCFPTSHGDANYLVLYFYYHTLCLLTATLELSVDLYLEPNPQNEHVHPIAFVPLGTSYPWYMYFHYQF